MGLEQYKIENYTDEELYEILELNSEASDGELEARIIQMIQKHMYLRTTTGRRLFHFFQDMYEHFFDVQVEKEEEEEDESVSQDHVMDVAIENPDLFEAENVNELTTPQRRKADEGETTLKVTDMEYTKGRVNPLLKETYKRIITIDSQYREDEYIFSTDFTMNFSEVLKDVVSLKLYAVQLPVTWYTISEGYGSNFFFFKPLYNEENSQNNTLGIYGGSAHEYKVEIDAGNYSINTLITEVSSKIETLKSSTSPDVSFGETSITKPVGAQPKVELKMDIQKIYNEHYYDVSYSSEIQTQFGIKTSTATQIYTKQPTTSQDNWRVDSTNNDNILEFIQYMPTSTQQTYAIDDNENPINPVINTIQVFLPIEESTKSGDEWASIITNLVKENPSFLEESYVSYDIYDKSFYWNLYPNRENVETVLNAKWVLKRGTGTNAQNFSENPFNEGSDHILDDTVNENSRFTFNSEQTITFKPKVDTRGGVYINPSTYPGKERYNDIQITFEPGVSYSITDMNTKLNENVLTRGTEIIDYGANYYIRYNINKIYTTKDYKIVFYDRTSFSRCLNPFSGFRNAKVDTTLGFILGYKTLTEYEMKDENGITVNGKHYFLNPDTGTSTNSIYSYTEMYSTTNADQLLRSKTTLRGDSVVSIYLYNYFMIILDDFKQNHLNDGLVTLTSRDTGASLPSYANRKNYRVCNTDTGTSEISSLANTVGLTQKQIYSVEQILQGQNQSRTQFNENASVRDMFALLPVKASNLEPGSIYVEFGGTLQQQERSYFGPVNIGRIAVKLVNDKGDVVDLNGGNWSFQLVCEQLYVK